jgi:diguanylate cyclase (GGDEF)-like protein
MGGDEFVIVLRSVAPGDEAAALAARLVKEMSVAFDLEGHHVVIGASIGIAVSSDQGADMDVLLKEADLALYRSKSAGRGTYCFFDADRNSGLDAQCERSAA